jgi:hypothetical protein
MKGGYKMYNKRGLSNVVSTVLIILLAIAAVVIIWQFVRPTIENAGSQLSSDCFQLDLEVVSCVDNGDDTADITYRWVGGEVDLSEVKVLVYDSTGVNSVADGTLPNFLETQNASADVSGISNVTEASVVGVIINEAGQELTCQESSKVTCS